MLACKDTKIEELKIKLDQLEQNQYEKSVRIVGMPEPKDTESDISNIQKFAQNKLEMNIKKSDVADIFRLGKITENRKCRDVIIKFKKKSVREQFYNHRKKLIPQPDQPNIYINEQLTEYRASLFYAARKLVKKKQLHSAWTQRGNILVRQEENDRPKQIKHHKVFAEITGEVDRDDVILDNEIIASDDGYQDSSEDED